MVANGWPWLPLVGTGRLETALPLDMQSVGFCFRTERGTSAATGDEPSGGEEVRVQLPSLTGMTVTVQLPFLPDSERWHNFVGDSQNL